MNGLGKTIQAIDLADKTADKILIVCPAMLIGTWKAELKKFRGTTEGTEIISYSSLKKAEEHFELADIVIADEAHYLKNPDSKRTQLFHHYIKCYRPERLVMLTGTAIKNRVPEIYSLLKLCDYNLMKTSGPKLPTRVRDYWGFCNYFTEAKKQRIGHKTFTKFEGDRNVEELKLLLTGKYLRRRASEVLNLPPIIRKDIVAKVKEDKDMYEAFMNKDKHFTTRKVASAMNKTKFTTRYAKELMEAGEGPLIIFSDHIDPITAIYNELSKLFRAFLITGDTIMSKRQDMMHMFQMGEADVICATIGALSVGVTLHKASNMIFNDLSWVPGDIAQAEKRIHRIGQENNCTIHRIHAGPIDARICAELDKKIKTITSVI